MVLLSESDWSPRTGKNGRSILAGRILRPNTGLSGGAARVPTSSPADPFEPTPPMPRVLTIVVLAALLLGSCAPSDPKTLTDEGASALGAGDAAKAQESFEAALTGIDPSHPEWLRASIGRCQALARRDGPAAKKAFLELATAHPSRVNEQDFSLVVSELVQHDAIVEAIDVMDAGVKLYPESPAMQTIKEKVLAASSKSKDAGALEKLKGLGYVGSD